MNSLRSFRFQHNTGIEKNGMNDLLFERKWQSSVNTDDVFDVWEVRFKRIRCGWNIQARIVLIGKQMGQIVFKTSERWSKSRVRKERLTCYGVSRSFIQKVSMPINVERQTMPKDGFGRVGQYFDEVKQFVSLN